MNNILRRRSMSAKFQVKCVSGGWSKS